MLLPSGIQFYAASTEALSILSNILAPLFTLFIHQIRVEKLSPDLDWMGAAIDE